MQTYTLYRIDEVANTETVIATGLTLQELNLQVWEFEKLVSVPTVYYMGRNDRA